jgi:nitrogenase molybdenum-iron protein NifN
VLELVVHYLVLGASEVGTPFALREGLLGESAMKKLMKETGLPPAPKPLFTATTNACKLCTPLGACLAFRGIEGAVPYLHGSQGCATYIRRYLISHYKEPMDIASSSFSEDTVVFGGKKNLNEGLLHVIQSYKPQVIGIATTCLAETIGDDVKLFLHEFKKEHGSKLRGVELVPVSTPAYAGTHIAGFWSAVRELVANLATEGEPQQFIGMFPGMVSPADIRHLKEILHDFRMAHVLAPDYSETLDGPVWDEYTKMPKGGTPVGHIRALGGAMGHIEFTSAMPERFLPGTVLAEKFDHPVYRMPMPIGISLTDSFFELLSELAGCSIPAKYKEERGRLIDAYVDGHKYLAGKKVAVFGEADFVVPMTSFLAEIGLKPVLCAAGDKYGKLKEALEDYVEDLPADVLIREGCDFADIEAEVGRLGPDLLVGNSKGYALSRRLNIPLLRVGFPIHDRIGGSRVLHLGYKGAQQLFDQVANMLIENAQDTSPVGYSYM